MLLPLALFAGLTVLFLRGLEGDPSRLPSALIGKMVPEFQLPAIPDIGAPAFDAASLRAGGVSVVNVWASWCVPCRTEHPLLAELAEVRLVAQLWLRPGNASCGSNSAAFFLDLWKNLPRHIRLKGVRADSGFCLPELLDLWERLKLPYVVVAQLSQPIQKIIKGDLKWTATEVPGTEVAELE